VLLEGNDGYPLTGLEDREVNDAIERLQRPLVQSVRRRQAWFQDDTRTVILGLPTPWVAVNPIESLEVLDL
jgi:hypothetical protein